MKIELFGADQELQEIITLDRLQEKVDEEEGYRYEVFNAVTGNTGYVNIALKNAEWWLERGEAVGKFFQKKVDEDEIIAEIVDFFPHKTQRAENIPLGFRKRGIGRSVLQTTITDLRNEGISNFYVLNPQYAFYNLLLQTRFRELRAKDGNEHLFRKYSQG